MSDQLTNNPEALRLFFTEDIFLVKEPLSVSVKHSPASESEQVQLPVKQAPVSSLHAPASLTQVPAPSSQAPVSLTPASVTLPVIEIKASEQANDDFNYVGANERNILILVYDKENPVSSIAGRQLLGMILKSIKLDRNDCALLNYASCDGADFIRLQAFFQPQYVFSFGVTPMQLGLPEAASNSIIAHEGSKLIFSSNLDDLSDDPATKKLLWTSLKQIELK
jgi:DNA polymerase III psi subunit